MLPMSCSDTSVPMEISAASLTSASISSGRRSDKSEPATFVRSPEEPQRHLATQEYCRCYFYAREVKVTTMVHYAHN